jgi:NAD(P)-dependent dehydrogenase (short-subunit alcohol dehydrogenase family)
VKIGRMTGDAGMLEGAVAVVTGAGRGIGRSEALRLAAYGARVVVNDAAVEIDGRPSDERPGAAVVDEIRSSGGEAALDEHDVSSSEGGPAVVQRALDEWGRVDVVVNNAGIGRPKMVFNMDDDQWDDVVRVHLRSTFLTTREACRWWRAESKAGRSGLRRVVNTSTGLLPMGGAGQSNYVAAKAGIAAFTVAVAQEMSEHGLTANAIMPGARTRMASVGWRMDAMEASGEERSPDHVAELVCFLASPAAQWISGQVFSVSGHRIGHVRAWTEGEELHRTERGWTAPELAREMPRLFGAAPPRNERPPDEWKASGRKLE